jgi:amino acid adenylation domain-containing protein/non-ribosomal peptide synthase protein (TIGR01720 family)
MTMTGVQGFRLSPQQEHLWSLAGGGAADRAQCTVEITGPLDVEALRRAAERLFARHEILRTVFRRQPGIRFPLQVIEDPQAPPWRELDLSAADPGDRSARLAQAALEERCQPLPGDTAEHGGASGTGLLLAHLGPGHRALVLTVPALCADAESLRNLVHELVELYDGRVPHGLADGDVVQYLQFSEWQNTLREEDGGSREHWRQLQRESPPRLPQELCTVHGDGFDPRSAAIALDPAVAAAVAALCARAETKIEAFLLACWQLLLGRVSNAANPVVRAIASGRSFEDLETCVGRLARALPVAVPLESGYRFEEVLQRTSVALEEALNQQEHCFWEEDELAAAAVDFEVRSWPPVLSARGAAFSYRHETVGGERFKLKLLVVRRGGDLAAELWYDPRVLAAPAVERLGEQWVALVRGAAERPDREIEDLDIASEAERRHLSDFNSGLRHPARSNAFACPEPERARSWLALFEAQAAATPASPAVACAGERLSYAELDARANRLARHLRRVGVGPEVRVAIRAERSLDLAVSLLGVLKAGGACVPLDPAYPPDRLSTMAEDAEVRAAVSRGPLEGLPEAVPRVDLDAGAEALLEYPGSGLGLSIEPESLAYVLFTSGSTGRPKAVGVQHGHLLSYVLSVTGALGFESGWSFAMVSTPSADLGHTAIFPTLATGGCLHVIPADQSSDPDSFADLCRAAGIDGLKIVPSHLEALLSAAHPEAVLPRKLLVLGGEASSWRLVERVRDLAPGCRVFNHYGPTEATVGTIVRPVEEGERGLGNLPLGRPLHHAEAYVLDDRLRPVPWEVPGEIHLGGEGLARGYLGRPAATAERFVPHPFSSEPGCRLYRTGDRARFGAGGELEFLGRTDHQVKLRGFRIELGEIEAVLESYPGVQEAIAVVREDRPGEHRLVAYVVAPRLDPDMEPLRSHARTKLPEPMVPAAVVLLGALPLNPNGKLDRAALPAPEQAAARRRAYDAPRTEAERCIAAVWAEVLGVEKVGLHDNFFELGGDSIQAIQAVARANREGFSIRARQFFQFRTLGELAAAAETETKAEAPVLHEQGSVHGPVPLTPIQAWFFEQRLGRAHHWNQTLMLGLDEPFDPRLLGQVLQHLLAHHDALRLRFKRDGEEWRQSCTEIELQQDATVPRVDLSAIPEDRQPAVMDEASSASQASLDLGSGPVTRWVLYDLGGRRSRMLMVFHHLVIDGVSWRILLEDLLEAYGQLRRGETAKLPAKTTSFKAWAHRLGEHSASPSLAAELPFWRLFAGGGGAPLPVDRPGGWNTVASARTVTVALDEDATEALLRKVASSYRADVQEVLMAVLALQLRDWTGSPEARVELEGMGREDLFEDVDLSRTVGWFTVHFPVRLDVGTGSDPGEALARVKEQLRQVPGRGIGYGLLRYLSPVESDVEDLRRMPESQISFNYLGQMDGTLPRSSPLWLEAMGRGADRDPGGRRPFLLEVVAHVLGGQLQVQWTYSESLHHRSTIEEQVRGYLEWLHTLVNGCRLPASVAARPSDFPLADLDEQHLGVISDLLAEIDAPDGP